MSKIIFLILFVFFINLLPINTSGTITKEVIVSYEDILNEPTRHIDPNKPMIALTFDDGPYRTYTTMILDTLKDYNAYATFFVLGDRIGKAPDLLERMILDGHEIGNHTYSHQQMTTLDEKTIIQEIDMAQQEIYNVIHRFPSVMRPPYGDYNETVLNNIKELRVVTWDVDSEDWRYKNAKTVVDNIMRDVKDKSIILLHDQYLSTAQAVAILVPRLIEEGYQLVTISDLYSFE